jgi:hypothetical protein
MCTLTANANPDRKGYLSASKLKRICEIYSSEKVTVSPQPERDSIIPRSLKTSF